MRLLEELTDLERIVLREALETYHPYAPHRKDIPADALMANRLATARELIFKLT